MNLNKADKEFIRAIVKYDGKAQSLADVLNKSRLLEKRGIGIVQHYDKISYFCERISMKNGSTETAWDMSQGCFLL